MTPTRMIVKTEDAPAPAGPYSQAIRYGDVLYCSGVLGIRASDGVLINADIAAETRQCLVNLDAICATAGTTIGHALKLTVYTTEIQQFDQINLAFREYFSSDPPARCTVGINLLMIGARIEIDAIVAM